jgi:NADPH:quinone reductase-like Zn-dependent oxidoreductase
MPNAYVYTASGGPEVETFADLPRPVPGASEILIKVRAAGVNPVDWKKRTGFGPPRAPGPQFPVVFGGEASGIVEEVGPGVTDFAVGDEVFGNTSTGGYAEYTLLPVQITARKPADLSFVDAATLPIAAATAYDGVQQLALDPGATLVVIGSGGGVGIAAVQIAVHTGVTVIGVASAGKKALIESAGATHVESGAGVADRIAAAAPDGVDAIYDLVGGEALEAVAPVLTDRSKLITAADRETVARLGGSSVERKRNREVLDAVAALAVEGVLKPSVTRTFPLSQAPAALRLVEGGHAEGKIVIEVGP